MKFKQAYEAMKAGAKVKLPSWGGFWFWDEKKRTIIMHTKENEEMDLRDTDMVDYTFTNICSDEWIIADETNTTALGGTPTFNFGEAIEQLKKGRKVCRKGWNGKGMFLVMQEGSTVKANQMRQPAMKSYFRNKGQDDITICPHIDMKAADETMVIGWLASQTDMLAEDWTFAE